MPHSATQQLTFGLGLPEISVHTRPSGLRVVSHHDPGRWGVNVGVFVEVGSRHEEPAECGLSHCVEHMLFRGCEGLPDPGAVSRAFEDRGGTLNAATHPDFTSYSLSVPASELTPILELLGRLLATPIWQGLDIEQGVLRQELLEDLDEAGKDINVEHALRRAFFGKHPLGQPVGGTLETLASFDEARLASWHRSHYRLPHMVLALSGKLVGQLEDQLTAFEAHFEAAAKVTRRPAAPAEALPEQASWQFVTHSQSQVDLRLALRTPGLDTPQLPALRLLNRILDDGLSSRLYRALCDGTGLAYDTFASLELMQDVGLFELGVSAEADNIEAAQRGLYQVLESLMAAPIPEHELAKAKRRQRWDLESLRDRSEDLVGLVALRIGLGLNIEDGLQPERYEQLRSEDLQEALRALLAGPCHRAAVGSLDGARQDALAKQLLSSH